jgi:transcriptional regulator with XRE-family HTH domain
MSTKEYRRICHPELQPFGRRVVGLRLARGWSQRDLARAADINPSQVSHMENGQVAPGAEILARVARVLGLTMDELWHGHQPKPKAARPKQNGRPRA